MASFGESLRRERELREISLREIADATKINLRYLEALEQNRFDILPGGVFNKGFIRAYARFIGADGESLVDAYLQQVAPPEPGIVPAAAGAPGLLRLAEAPKRRADQGAPAAGTAGGAKPAAPLAFPAGSPAPAASPSPSSPPAPAASPSPAAPPSLAVPPSPATAPAHAARATRPGGSQAAAMPAARPAAESRPSPAPRPAAPLRVATAPAHHEPLTERAAAFAAITNPPAPGQPVARRRSGLTLGITLAAGGLVLAGGLAILVTRGLGARDGAHPSQTATAGEGETRPEDAAPLESTLGPGTEPPAGIGEAPAMPTPESATLPALSGINSSTGPERTGATANPATRAGDPRNTASPTTPPAPPRETRADPGSAPRGAAPPPAATTTEEAPRPPALPGMEFRVEATSQVWVQVSCDGEDKVNRMLQSGEGATLRCLSVVRVSVTDGGAVRLMVDGARCVTPAESGYEMKGFVIRAENAAAICPPAAGGLNGRR